MTDQATDEALNRARQALLSLLDVLPSPGRPHQSPKAIDDRGRWWRTPDGEHDGPGVIVPHSDGGRFVYITGPDVRYLGWEGHRQWDSNWAPLRPEDARDLAYALLAAADDVDPTPTEETL